MSCGLACTCESYVGRHDYSWQRANGGAVMPETQGGTSDRALFASCPAKTAVANASKREGGESGTYPPKTMCCSDAELDEARFLYSVRPSNMRWGYRAAYIRLVDIFLPSTNQQSCSGEKGLGMLTVPGLDTVLTETPQRSGIPC